jgi:hypothetical protein
VFIAWGEGRFIKSSPGSVLAHLEVSDNSTLDSAITSDNAVLQEREFRDRPMVQIPTDRILREYYSETLSVIPALMFSPVSMQLAFAATVNTPIDEHGNTLLHLASRSGDVFAAWQLLELGANPQIANCFHKKPIHVVCLGNPQVTDALTAAFSSHHDSIAEVLFRRTTPEAPVVPVPVPSRRTAETSTTAGLSIGVITH